MRIQSLVLVLGALGLLLVGALAVAQSDDVADGKTLYLAICSGCHGLIESQSSLPGPVSVRLALALPAGGILTDGSFGGSGHYRGGPGRTEALWPKSGERVAIAPPFGPTLRGVFGRVAGSVAGFEYSREFRRVLAGVVWNHETLDTWITDSQGWVPGSMMFYKQPDPETRRKIIGYLATAR